MENAEKKNVVPVKLTEGEFAGYVCCADCRFSCCEFYLRDMGFQTRYYILQKFSR